MVWEFNGDTGVWNIVGGTLIGGQGPQGAQGPEGPTGATGGALTGDQSAFIVNQALGVGTVRLGGVGTTGVVGFGGRFDVANGIVSHKLASTSVTGVAAFDSQYFSVSTTGAVKIAGTMLSISDQTKQEEGYAYGADINIEGATGVYFVKVAKGEYEIQGLTATTAKYGMASFHGSYFTISATGAVRPSAAYQVTGDSVQAGQGINLSANKTIGNIGVQSVNGITGSISLTGAAGGVLFFKSDLSGIGATASSTMVFNGTSLTFGSSTSTFTITGPNMVLGAATQITGGIFKNPAEAAPMFTLGSGVNTLVINGASGSIQRFSITPTGRVTIRAGTSWHDFTTATETIAVIVQNNSGFTGVFDSNILVDGGFNRGKGEPSLFAPSTNVGYGVTGGISVFTLMRVNKGGNAGLTMGFVVSTGMTAAQATIN
jgi:hypothetical protein